MSEVGEARSAFLAGPFNALVDPATRTMHRYERARYEALIGHLERRGYTVYNAHRREGWGADFLEPDECTRLDFEEIRRADLFIALPGAPPSPGTHIEIGWASALDKPIMLLLEEGQPYAFLVRGLHAVARVTTVPVRAGRTGLDEFATALEEMERRFLPPGRAGMGSSRSDEPGP